MKIRTPTGRTTEPSHDLQNMPPESRIHRLDEKPMKVDIFEVNLSGIDKLIRKRMKGKKRKK